MRAYEHKKVVDKVFRKKNALIHLSYAEASPV